MAGPLHPTPSARAKSRTSRGGPLHRRSTASTSSGWSTGATPPPTRRCAPMSDRMRPRRSDSRTRPPLC